MNIWLKRILIGAVVLMLAIAGAAIAFVATFNPDVYVLHLQNIIQQKYNRTLEVNGPVKVSLLPEVVLSAKDVSLSQEGSAQVMLSMDTIKLAIKPWPLIKKELAVNYALIKGLEIGDVSLYEAVINADRIVYGDAFDISNLHIIASGKVGDFEANEIAVSTSALLDQDSQTVSLRETGLAVKGGIASNIKGIDIQIALPNIETSTDADFSSVKTIAGLLSHEPVSFNAFVESIVIDDAVTSVSKPISEKPSVETKKDDTHTNAFNQLISPFLAMSKAKGSVSVKSLKINSLSMDNLNSEVNVNDGTIEITPINAQFADGRLNGSLTIDSHENARLNLRLQDVDAGLIAVSMANENRIKGRGNVDADLSFTGLEGKRIIKSLTGKADLSVKDGVWYGIDLDQTMDQLRDTVKDIRHLRLPPFVSSDDSTLSTHFESLQANLSVKRGMASLDRLNIDSGRITVKEHKSSRIDLVNQSVDVKVLVRKKGRDGSNKTDISRLQGINVPLRLKGPFGSLSYSVELQGIAESTLKEALKGDSIKELGKSLKGLFK